MEKEGRDYPDYVIACVGEEATLLDCIIIS